MRDRFFSLLVTCGVIPGLLLVSQVAMAQTAGMYRVELMVFVYPAGGAAEQWEALPELAYPESTRFLDPPGGRQPIGNTVEPAVPADSSAAAGPAMPPMPMAYVLLPAAERELRAGAASMQGSGRYRILFHEAWLQPMPGQSSAIPIVLDHSGESGDWPELQGTITLYQAGDYVLETNLWLNTRGEYLPGTWRMPPPPRGPGPDSVPEAPMVLDASPPSQGTSGPPDESPAEGASDYPFRHAVLLRQTRRMRSGEVYYIDHPMLGVAVKITSLDATATAPAGSAEIPPQSSAGP